jgi:acyl carrier protein phosphodiesterase
MNWLAHVFLSPDDIDFQIGNLVTDTLKPAQLEISNTSFKAGVECHYEIDRFTDSHEIVRQCKQMFFPTYRHFSAVLMDIFFDYFLAISWHKYSAISYEGYIENFYDQLSQRNLVLGEEGEVFLESIIESNRLGIYDTISGVERALERISQRRKVGSKIDIVLSIKELNENHEELLEKFNIFFPELQAHIRVWSQKRGKISL